MSLDYVLHHARADQTTVCGQPWQGWQAPAGALSLPPDDPPRSGGRLDRVYVCQDCMELLRLAERYPYREKKGDRSIDRSGLSR